MILATGGFPWSEAIRKNVLSEVPFGLSATSPDSNGDGISIAVANGARIVRVHDVKQTKQALAVWLACAV